MKRRGPWVLVPAAAGALLLNFALFAAAAALVRDRSPAVVSSPPVPVTLVTLRPPRPQEPAPRPEPPPPVVAEPAPPRTFVPDLAVAVLNRPGPRDVKVALDADVLRTAPPRQEFVFEAQDLDQPPRAVLRTPADYPLRARQRGIEGFVEVKFLVGADGSVGSIQILQADPPEIFDAAALRAIPNWRFEPGRLDGRPVPSWVRTRVVFTLN